ncbi:Uncharacterised protein [Klebsiella pneumoniae]|nr:Uncharacterised protein [Klebsiella pneumoniae]
MITIHGVVQVTISTAKVETLCTRLKAKRPTKMKPIEATPISTVACTRESRRGNTLDMSSPVPYSEVVPVDMPPITAIRHTGRKNQPGAMASRPPT